MSQAYDAVRATLLNKTLRVSNVTAQSSTQTTEDGYDALRKSGPWTVPLPDVYLSRNENSAQTYGFEPKDAKSRYRRLGNDAQRVTVGPMPVTSFMNTFLPTPQDLVRRMPPCKNLFNGIKPQNALESSIYKVLVSGPLLLNHLIRRQLTENAEAKRTERG